MRKHPIASIYVLGPILSIIIGVLFTGRIVGFLGWRLDLLTGEKYCFQDFAAVLGSFLLLFLFTKWFAPEYKGCFKKLDGSVDRKFGLLMLAAVIIDIAYCLTGSDGFIIPNAITLAAFADALSAGVLEETACRALPISIAMRKGPEKKHMITALAVACVPFGLLHLMNLFSTEMSVTMVLVQVVFAVGIGFLFATIYMRTGNILVSMCLHFLHDFLINLAKLVAQQQGIDTNEVSAFDIVTVGIFGVCCIIIAILMLKGHEEEITVVWNDRWSR